MQPYRVHSAIVVRNRRLAVRHLKSSRIVIPSLCECRSDGQIYGEASCEEVELHAVTPTDVGERKSKLRIEHRGYCRGLLSQEEIARLERVCNITVRQLNSE